MSDQNSPYILDIGGDVKGIIGDVKGGVVYQYIIANKSQAEIHSEPLIEGSPYLGLNKFEPRDKDKFFGREQWITRLSKDLEQDSLIVLLGVSGGGKSSLVQAGIIPYLSDRWGASKLKELIFVPYTNPFESLYYCLPNESKKIASEIINQNKHDALIKLTNNLKENSNQWIIFIDQFEEIFTSTPKLKRDRFITNLVSLIKQQDSFVKIIIAMRSDFLDNLREYGDFINEVEGKIRLIRDMTESEIRLAIAEPAARNGVTFEKGLVEQIINDFERQAGSLPLLQYTLNLLWEKNGVSNDNRVLNRKTYDDLGGVSGALQKQANKIYNQKLNDEEKKAAKQIFIELIDLGVRKPVSRRVEKSQFTNDPIRESTLDKLIESRLLVSGREKTNTVEVAHEELLRSWDFTQKLIQEHDEILILRSRLISDAKQYDEIRKENPEKAKYELWSGFKLERVGELINDKAFEYLDKKSKQFIKDSIEETKLREKQKDRELKLIQEKLEAEIKANEDKERALKAKKEALKATQEKLEAEIKANEDKERALKAKKEALKATQAKYKSEKIKNYTILMAFLIIVIAWFFVQYFRGSNFDYLVRSFDVPIEDFSTIEKIQNTAENYEEKSKIDDALTYYTRIRQVTILFLIENLVKNGIEEDKIHELVTQEKKDLSSPELKEILDSHDEMNKYLETAKIAEKRMVALIIPNRLKKLQDYLDKNIPGVFKDKEPKLSDKENKFTKGAFRETYSLIMKKNDRSQDNSSTWAVQADLDDDGSLSLKETLIIPCDVLIEIEKNWKPKGYSWDQKKSEDSTTLSLPWKSDTYLGTSLSTILTNSINGSQNLRNRLKHCANNYIR